MTFIDKLKKMYACQPAIRWLKRRKFRTFQQAWNKCNRPDWMRWYLNDVYSRRGGGVRPRRFWEAEKLYIIDCIDAKADPIRQLYPKPLAFPKFNKRKRKTPCRQEK